MNRILNVVPSRSGERLEDHVFAAVIADKSPNVAVPGELVPVRQENHVVGRIDLRECWYCGESETCEDENPQQAPMGTKRHRQTPDGIELNGQVPSVPGETGADWGALSPVTF